VLDMRRFVIRAAIAVTLLTVLWFFTSRWCSLLVDQFYTERLATLQSSPLGWNGNRLQFGPAVSNILGPTGWTGPDLLNGGHIVDLTGPGPDYKQVAELKVNADDQLMLLKDGKSFVLGSRAGTLPGADDVTSLRRRRGRYEFGYSRMQPIELADAVRVELHDGVRAILATLSLLSSILEKTLRRATQHRLALPPGLRLGQWLDWPNGPRVDPDRDPASAAVTPRSVNRTAAPGRGARFGLPAVVRWPIMGRPNGPEGSHSCKASRRTCRLTRSARCCAGC
jgi:hypothetical protein